MNVVFLPDAEKDVDRLYDFLLKVDPLAAQKAMLAIDEGIDLLLEHPLVGVEMLQDSNYRQLYIPFGISAYVLRYRIDFERQQVLVVRVWHGRESRSGR